MKTPTLILLLLTFCAAGCGGGGGGSNPTPRTGFDAAGIDGSWPSSFVLTTNGMFAGHHTQVVTANFYDSPTGPRVSADIPVMRYLDLPVSQVPVSSPSYRGEWRGTFTYDGRDFQSLVFLDEYGRIFFLVTNGGSEGKSDTIGWRFDTIPSGAG